MSSDGVLLEERAGALWVIFDRPDELNPMDRHALETLEAAVDQARDGRPVALVLIGRGKAFSAGADLKWLRSLLKDGLSQDSVRFFSNLPLLLRKMEELPVPVIAGLNGLCTAGGMELTCAADLVVAAESARIADGHSNFGLMPIGGTAHRLIKRVGLSNAKRLFFTGDFISAEEALRMGLVNWVVPDEQLEKHVEALCESLAAKAPEVLQRMKLIANHAASASPEVGTQFELQLGLEHLKSDIVREGLSAFTERRKPNFR